MLLNSPSTVLQVAIVMPVRDDWASAEKLIPLLDQALSSSSCALQILLVDDASIQKVQCGSFYQKYSAVRSIQVLRLRRNLGHQRAIAVGLVHLWKVIVCDAVVVMDSDGEDTTEGVLQLLRAFNSTSAIFAERRRRTESNIFRLSYFAYRILHRLLTGVSVKVGNFSILPASYLHRLVVMSELWNHYAAAVFRSGLPITTTPIDRGHRIAGISRMNFVSLVLHGMSAISVFGDVAGVRLLVASILASSLVLLGILIVIAIRLFTAAAIPGWATYTVGILVIILIQLVTIATSFTFTLLSNRINLSFVPLRDYKLFVAELNQIYPYV